jgi:hypothetical protein
MIQTVRVLTLLAVVAASTAAPYQARPCPDHIRWAGDVTMGLLSIKPGMTRADLLKVFQTQGGLSIGLSRSYASRECAYFHVDVEFEPVGRPARDASGRVTLVEDNRDIIRKISRPYVGGVVAD